MNSRFGLDSGMHAPFLPVSQAHHGHHRNMRGFGDDLINSAKQAGGNVVTGLVNDAKDAGGKVVTGLVNDAKDAVGDAIGGIFGGGGGGPTPTTKTPVRSITISPSRTTPLAIYQPSTPKEQPPAESSMGIGVVALVAVAVAAYFYMKR